MSEHGRFRLPLLGFLAIGDAQASLAIKKGHSMRITRIVVPLVISLGLVYAATASEDVAVSPQYDTTHVYVAPAEFDRFVASLIATFGGTAAKQGVFTVTPTSSSTMSQLVLTPVGSISVFGFKTPI